MKYVRKYNFDMCVNTHSHTQGADNVSVHASDGELSPSPAARHNRSGSPSSSSSGEASDDGRRGRKIASALVDPGVAHTMVATVEATDEEQSGDNRRRGVTLMDNRRGESEDGDDSVDRRKVIREDGGDDTSVRRRRRHGGQKAVSQGGHGADVHESEAVIQRNLVRSPAYGDYVPMFSPPPPFPGYGGRSGYVQAVAAGSASASARDARYGDSRGYHEEDRRSSVERRARSRGRFVDRRQVDDRARSRGRSIGPRVGADEPRRVASESGRRDDRGRREERSRRDDRSRSRRRSRSRSRR
jgi:hypothetical protein